MEIIAETIEDLNADFGRSNMAESVRIGIEHWVSMLNHAQYAVTHGYKGGPDVLSEYHSAYMSEIARLQAEVERLRETLYLEECSHIHTKSDCDTAWNDAIEAAASRLDDAMTIEGARRSIRALKRPTGDTA